MIGFLVASAEGTGISRNRPVVYHMRGMQKVCGWLGLTDQSLHFEWKADLAEAGIVFLRYRSTPGGPDLEMIEATFKREGCIHPDWFLAHTEDKFMIIPIYQADRAQAIAKIRSEFGIEPES
jgi:hypothetical protein